MNFKHYLKHPGAILLFLKNPVSKTRKYTQKRAFDWAVRSPRRSSFYYWFFSKRFDREHFSVLNGKHAHLIKENTTSKMVTLRRSIHMIEKGIITIPRKAVWAEGYIIQTIQHLEFILKNNNDFNTKKWAFDVLTKYFQLVEQTDRIKKAKLHFETLKNSTSTQNAKKEIFSPYTRNDSKLSEVSYKAFFDLCNQRRSVRWYEDREVPMELVKKAIEVGVTAPSACNRQPFRFIVVTDKEVLKRTVTLPMGCVSFAENIKMMVILVGDQSSYFDERDRHLIYIDGGLAAMNFMMGLETQGLSSCPINWSDIEEREKRLSEEFDLEVYERGIMFFSIGYPLKEGGIAYSAKKEVNDIIKIY
ncbi:nitroreductase family protein [Psychroserpens sp. Hel_I_66]|uniref:nitroreductase family protein n=1 Tax=Psychroserpens sp. Hel_I_66 TaxID=1250004 RepID=UPI0006918240|nr:nitroreductase family protein [Psychroserpens sp. Hel_I_66]